MALFVLLLSPFLVFTVMGFWRGFTIHPAIQWRHTGTSAELSTAVLVAMWNYMGWDNASTVAQEVENPQRNYPLAMVGSAVLVAVTYILPLLAMALAGLSSESFSTGAWVDAARSVGGNLLGLTVVAGGVISGFGMFNALVMSYTRLPMAMAEDDLLPRVVARRNTKDVPWVSVLFCGLAWALALNLQFERLISIDLILYGASLILEFVALVVLRRNEPNLERPFRAGNMAFAVALGVGPAALIVYALWACRDERVGNFSALLFALLVALLGPVLYWITTWKQNKRDLAPTAAD
jgi:amino acid transporter